MASSGRCSFVRSRGTPASVSDSLSLLFFPSLSPPSSSSWELVQHGRLAPLRSAPPVPSFVAVISRLVQLGHPRGSTSWGKLDEGPTRGCAVRRFVRCMSRERGREREKEARDLERWKSLSRALARLLRRWDRGARVVDKRRR